MSDIFISYSRQDKPSVQRMHDALATTGKDLWVDWHGIPKGSEFLDEIKRAIEAADCFLIAITSEQAASKYCGMELQHALKYRKRLIPVVLDDVETSALPNEVASINWIFLRDTDDFEQGIRDIVEVAETNPDWVHLHTRILTRAVQWEETGKDRSLLLRGKDLLEVEQQLGQVAEEDSPRPTALQRQYIAASRLNYSKFWRTVLLSISGALVVVLGLAIVATVLKFQADDHAAEAAHQADRYARSTFGLQLRRVRDELDGHYFESSQLLLNDPQKCLPSLRSFVWGYYYDQSQRERRRLAAHTKPVNAICRSANDAWLASSSDDQTIKIWPLPDFENPLVLKGHQDEIWTVEASPTDEHLLASGSKDGIVYLWNLNTPDAPQEISSHSGESASVTNVSFHPDGQRLAISHKDGLVKLVDLTTGTSIKQTQTEVPTHDLAWSLDGKQLAAGCGDGSVRFWDKDLSNERAEMLQDGEVRSVAFLNDGDRFVTGGSDSRVRIWGIPTDHSLTPKQQYLIKAQGTVHCLKVSTEWITWGTSAGQVAAWKLASKFDSQTEAPPSVQWQIVAAGDSPDPINKAVYGVCLPGETSGVLSAAHDGTIREWQIDDPSPAVRVAPDGVSISKVRLNSLGTVAALTTADGKTAWHDLEKPDRLLHVLEPPELQLSDDEEFDPFLAMMLSEPIDIAINDDGTLLAPIFSRATTITVHRTDQTESAHKIIGHNNELSAAVFSKDSRYFATVDESGFLQVHESSGWQIYGSHNFNQPVYKLKFSADAKRLFATLADGSLSVVDTRSRNLPLWNRVSAVSEKTAITDLTIDDSGRRCCIIVNGSVFVAPFTAFKQPEFILLTKADETAVRLCCSPDGNLIATGHKDGAVQLWDSRTGDLRGLIRPDLMQTAENESLSVVDIFFHPVLRRLFVIHANGSVAAHNATNPKVWPEKADEQTKSHTNFLAQ